jgi:hypothetical protein
MKRLVKKGEFELCVVLMDADIRIVPHSGNKVSG